VAVLDEAGRAAKLAEVVAFYDDYGRGMDGMQLPYVARCYRAVVAPRPGAEDEEGAETGERAGAPDNGDTDMLLIDFR
jgi:hypothetical protein